MSITDTCQSWPLIIMFTLFCKQSNYLILMCLLWYHDICTLKDKLSLVNKFVFFIIFFAHIFTPKLSLNYQNKTRKEQNFLLLLLSSNNTRKVITNSYYTQNYNGKIIIHNYITNNWSLQNKMAAPSLVNTDDSIPTTLELKINQLTIPLITSVRSHWRH